MNNTNLKKFYPSLNYTGFISFPKPFPGSKPKPKLTISRKIFVINLQLSGTSSTKAPLLEMSEDYLVDSKELVLASLLLLINLPLLMIILGRKMLRGRKTHQLFMNIAIVQILSAISIIVSNFANSHMNTYLIINNGLLIEMFEMLMILSCERVMAIKYSFKYGEVRGRHIIALLICTWILPIVYVALGIVLGFSLEASLILSTTLINFAAISLGTTNLIVYHIAKKHDKFLKENAMVSTKAVTNVKSLKASYICFAIVASFMLLWTPYCIHNILWLAGSYEQADDNGIFSQVVEFIAYFHGVFDPLAFIWLSQVTKKEISKMFNSIRSKSGKDAERSMQSKNTESST